MRGFSAIYRLQGFREVSQSARVRALGIHGWLSGTLHVTYGLYRAILEARDPQSGPHGADPCVFRGVICIRLILFP